VAIFSPNCLHDAHFRFVLGLGADAIGERPLILDAWNFDGPGEMQRQRLHPAVPMFLTKRSMILKKLWILNSQGDNRYLLKNLYFNKIAPTSSKDYADVSP